MRRLLLIAVLLLAWPAWAAPKYAVVSGALSATLSGTTDFTQAGFGAVKAAIVFVPHASTTNNPQTSGAMSIGFWDGTNSRTISFFSTDNLATSTSTRVAATDAVATIQYLSSRPSTMTTICSYTASAITDGVRLTLSVDNTSTSRYATVVLFGGTSSAVAGTITPNATQDATATVSGLAFAPDVVFFLSDGSGGGSANLHAITSFGVAVDDGSTTQRSVLQFSVDNVDTSVTGRRLETDSIGGQYYNDMLYWTAQLTAWSSDGFTLTTRDGASGGDVMYYMAVGLDGDSAYLGTLTTPTSTGNNSVTATAFTPEVAILGGATTSLNTGEAHSGWLLSATDGTTSQALATHDADNLDTTDANSKRAASVVNMLNPTNGTDDLVASFVSFNSNGRTYNYTTVNAAARYGWELLIGSPSADGASIAPHMQYYRRLRN